VIYRATWNDRIMADEIFGPILAVMVYDDIDEAILEVKKHPKSLSAFFFSKDQKAIVSVRVWPHSVSELRRVSLCASKKALTTSLRSLEAAKIIVRRDLSASVLSVEYELSELIRTSLVELLDHLAEWVDFYEAAKAKPNIADRHSGGKN